MAHRSTSAHVDLRPPRGLCAETFEIGGDVFAILEWPTAASVLASGELTESERDVLVLVLQGLSNAAVAGRRGRSPRTVANQVASIFRRLGVASRQELFALSARGR